ncbi:uncharacterized protein [Rutidosis leptorrhynchoides]|uniref:uncharacterized protein n=1 Tax=Rutidosis leptorrhynchoides TaxID=125765 RepID=UPI003A996786
MILRITVIVVGYFKSKSKSSRSKEQKSDKRRVLPGQYIKMGVSKTEINLKRLLAAAPQQQNKVKMMHYVATLREQLEQIALEHTSDGLPRPDFLTVAKWVGRVACLKQLMLKLERVRVGSGQHDRIVICLCVHRLSKASVNDYSEKIEAIAAKLATPVPDVVAFHELRVDTSTKENVSKKEEEIITSPGLRRRLVSSSAEHRGHDPFESTDSSPVKLDAEAQTHITKHRKLQEDLTDEMVLLARQLKENSIKMNKSIHNTERILESTEKAVEHSLASTGHVNTRATAIYSQGFKTSCFTWFMMFVMTCIFVMVVLLIKVT